MMHIKSKLLDFQLLLEEYAIVIMRREVMEGEHWEKEESKEGIPMPIRMYYGE